MTGEKLVSLPEKHMVEHKITLLKEEKDVYDKIFGFSQTALGCHLHLKKRPAPPRW